jgi:membrane protein implicated in regulation of membrane protease activity
LASNKLKGVWVKQIALIAGSFLLGLVLTYYFGFIAGLSLIVLVGLVFYIRRSQQKALRNLGFSDEKAGGSFAPTESKISLKYVCMSCGSRVKGAKCATCGSQAKRATF